MRMSNEIKAGLVIVTALLMAVFLFAKTATFGHSTYEIKTAFRYGGNLKPDAIVKLSGIEVGRLTEIKLVYEPDTMVQCVLEVDSKAKFRADSIAYIDTAGFVGDAFVGITPGTSEEFVKRGGMVNSEDPVQMRLLMKKADSIAENLDKIMAEVKSVVVDNRGKFDEIIMNIEAVSENFKEFSEDVKKNPWKLLFKPSGK